MYLISECSHYTTLNTRDRSMKVPRGGFLKCDQSGFVKKWYRFMGAAGSAMPTKCVAKNHCGTHAPGWLSGSHPTQAQGMVTRKVCYHWNNNCCLWSNNIRVRNCGKFYVYELSRTPHCHLRYCGNGEPVKPPVPQECQKYTVFKDADRASGNAMKVLKCDQSGFVKKWYRFMGAAGSAMPTKCVAMNHCGTHAPGWLSGSHPTQAQGMVTRKVCYHWSNKCCLWSNNIRVRNCGGFYVYELSRTPHCHLRYCGNGGPGILRAIS
ncbi:hypothetical protein QZH41_017386 [Actinostola sp. cb2023]|nr:hypothetical protein QZH41_017386 [Actinostola sp. cb2023]